MPRPPPPRFPLAGEALIDSNKPRLAGTSHFDFNLEIECVILDELVTCKPLARVEFPVAPPTATPLPLGNSAVVIIALQRVHLNQLRPMSVVLLLVQERDCELGSQWPNQLIVVLPAHEVEVHGEEQTPVAVSTSICCDVEAELVTPRV